MVYRYSLKVELALNTNCTTYNTHTLTYKTSFMLIVNIMHSACTLKTTGKPSIDYILCLPPPPIAAPE